MQKNLTKIVLASVVFLGSLVLYILTVAPTVSFWDTGEFIATAYTLGIPHPPGSPLYILLGRIFGLLPIAADPALRVNMMSPLAAAGANLLTFLIIVQLVKIWRGGLDKASDQMVAYTGGIIGAFTFAMTDSHWFNAVESEVYAISTFATALVVWMIFKWAEEADEPGNERYLLGIAYIMGLSIGVHLLNLLALPVIALVIYYRKYSFQWSTFLGTVGATLGAFLIIYLGIIKGLPKIMSVQYLGGNIGFVLVGLLVVGVFGATYWVMNTRRHILTVIGMAMILILVGYSSYSMIYIRANQDPNINENDPSNPARFVSYLEREQYGQHSILDRAGVWEDSRQNPGAYKADQTDTALDFLWDYQIKYMYLRYFGWQFLGKTDFSNPQLNEQVNMAQYLFLPFLLGLFGMVHHFQRDRKRAFIILTLFLMTGLAIVAYLNQPDPQPRERDYSYVGSFMAFSLWIGLGASGLMELIQDSLGKRKQQVVNAVSYGLVVILLLAIPGLMLAKNYHSHDRSGNFVAWDYSYNTLETVAPDGIIFTNGDNDTFPLWYLQEVENVRPDVRIVNLSLLNTHWYIKQLRDYEPQILPESLSDTAIDQMFPMRFQTQMIEIPVPVTEENPQGRIRFQMDPTYQGQAIRVQDMMILRILQENLGRRPVYFALTVSSANTINLGDFLQVEGLAQRVMPYQVEEPIQPELVSQNLFETYQYRNLANQDVYLNDDIKNLLQNYRSCFLQLSMHYYQRGLLDSTRIVLDEMSNTIPEERVPFTNQDVYIQIGQLYAEAGQPEILRNRLNEVLSDPSLDYRQRMRYGWLFASTLNEPEIADSIFTEIYNANPNDGQVVGGLLQIYETEERWQAAINVLNRWLQNNPGDQSAQQLLSRYQESLDAASDTGSND